MKTWKYMFLCAGLSLMTASCSSDEEMVTDRNVISIEAVHPSQTRVTDTNFESNDKIGLYMVKSGTIVELGGNELNNECFSYDGSVWKSRKLFWNEGKHDVYAYYPFNIKINSVENYSFHLALDQNAAEFIGGMSGYEASDFLWASQKEVSASSSPIQLKFKHCMSKLNINLVKGEDYEGEIPSDLEVYIHNTVPVASIDLTTGGVSKDNFAGKESIKARKHSTSLFTACVVPQQITSRRPLVEVVSKGVSYLLEGKISLKQGVQHTITVTLSKNPDQTKIEIGGDIENWNSEN